MRLGREVAVFALALRTEHLGALHPMARLPLASLAFPALRLRPRPELAHVLDAVQAMTHADGHVSVFEYCLGTLLQRQIRESLDPGAYRAFGRTAPFSRARTYWFGRSTPPGFCTVARSRKVPVCGLYEGSAKVILPVNGNRLPSGWTISTVRSRSFGRRSRPALTSFITRW